MAALTSQLEAKEQQLQEKKLRLADLQAELSRVQQQRKIAMEGQSLVIASCLSAFWGWGGGGAVSYTHLRAPRDRHASRMPSSA